MNLALRIIKNSFFLSLTTLLDRLAELVLVFLMARPLGPSFVGDYKTVVMYLNIFQNLANYGLTQLVMREVATLRNREEASALLMNYGFASLWIALALLVIMNVTGTLIAYPPVITLGIYVVSLALIPGAWRRVAEATISGMESMEYIALVSFLGSVFRLVISMILLWQGQGLMVMFAVLVVTQFAVIPAYLYIIDRFLAPVRFGADFSYVQRMARDIGAFLIMGILLAGIGSQLDVIMIRKLATATQAGFYTAAYTLVQAVVLIRLAILQSVFPNMSHLFQTSLPKFRAFTEELLRFFIVVFLPIPLLTVVLAKSLISTLLGRSFADSAVTLQVLIWVLPFSFIYATLSRALIAGKQERANIRIAGISTAANVFLNLAFIPRWGASGAALSSVLAMAVAAAYSYLVVRIKLFPLPLREILGKPLFCVAVMGLAAYLLRHIALWIVLPTLLVSYGLALLWTKTIPPRLIELAHRVIKASASNLKARGANG